MSEYSPEQQPKGEDLQPLVLDEPAAEGDAAPEPEAQPFEEPAEGGDPDSTEGADIPTESLDLDPADSTDHSDQVEDESNEAG